MGRAEKKSYADLQGAIVDPSIWPAGEEGDAARAAFLTAMDRFTAGAVDRKEAEEKAARYLGIVSGVLGKIPGIAAVL